jgi:hypothetical protein
MDFYWYLSYLNLLMLMILQHLLFAWHLNSLRNNLFVNLSKILLLIPLLHYGWCHRLRVLLYIESSWWGLVSATRASTPIHLVLRRNERYRMLIEERLLLGHSTLMWHMLNVIGLHCMALVHIFIIKASIFLIIFIFVSRLLFILFNILWFLMLCFLLWLNYIFKNLKKTKSYHRKCLL